MTFQELVIDAVTDQADPYYADAPYTDRCICGAERADDTFCADCRGQHENLLSTALRSLPNQAEPAAPCRNCGGAHHIQRCPQIWEYLRAEIDDVCVSCGDALGRPGPGFCNACTEAAEPRRLSVKARAVAALALVLLAFALLACSDANIGDGSCRGDFCYSQSGHNP